MAHQWAGGPRDFAHAIQAWDTIKLADLLPRHHEEQECLGHMAVAWQRRLRSEVCVRSVPMMAPTIARRGQPSRATKVAPHVPAVRHTPRKLASLPTSLPERAGTCTDGAAGPAERGPTRPGAGGSRETRNPYKEHSRGQAPKIQ